MSPYFTERLAKEHRDDLLRAAEMSRLAHTAEIKARHRVRGWGLLIRFRTPRHRARERNGSGGASCATWAVADIRGPAE